MTTLRTKQLLLLRLTTWWMTEMTLKQKWGVSTPELLATGFVVLAGMFALADGYRLLSGGPAAASWTATYVMVAGVVLALLAAASLLPFSRNAAAKSVTVTVADDVLGQAYEDEDEPVLDEDVPPGVAGSLLLTTTGLLVVWILVLPLIGYIAATALFLLAYGLLVSRRPLLSALIFAAAATAAMAVLFQAVGIRLPMGTFF